MARATEALRDATLILVGHGAGGRAAIVERHARTIRRGGTFAAVRTCSLQDGDGLDRTLAGARGENAYILPVLMADGFTMRILSARIAEHAAGAVLCRPVGTLPGLADLLAEQALRTAAERGWSPAETAVLVAAHGTARNPGSARIAEAHAERIRRSGRFAAVEAG
ncbi:MAG: hypothetical protein HOK81_01590, partial [Rhodospirillaceae bacterium]|nr:hypothetical protein [Rhodospirillaceae bacterium]